MNLAPLTVDEALAALLKVTPPPTKLQMPKDKAKATKKKRAK